MSSTPIRKITEDLDILDSDLSSIDFNFLQSISPSNLKSIDKALQSYKELCQRQIEIKQKHNKENFKSISKSADLLNITDRFFSKVNPNLTLKEVIARLEDLKKLNLQMVMIMKMILWGKIQH